MKRHPLCRGMLLAVISLLLLVAGCSDDDTTGPETTPYTGPETVAELMESFVVCYEDLDLEVLEKTLHPDFRCILQAATVAEYPDLGTELDRDQEVGIAGRMFSGMDLTDPDGGLVPGLEAVEFLVMQQTAAWDTVPAGQDFEDALFAPYDVIAVFNRGEEHSLVRVEGSIVFYATVRDSVHEGTTHSFWQMIGQKDLTAGAKSVEVFAWGDVKAMYRPATENPYEGPETVDVLMASFQEAYESRDADRLLSLLHPEFQCVLQASTISQFPDVGTTLDWLEEARIAERMLSGLPVMNPDGELVPGIANIRFEIFERQGTWEDEPPNGFFPGSKWATFDVVILCDRGQGNSTLKPLGQINFYATVIDSVHEGTPYEFWQLVGQKDLTLEQKSRTETASWGTIKCLYR